MATERTFIKWLQLASLIFLFALYLKDKSDLSGHKVLCAFNCARVFLEHDFPQAVSYTMLTAGLFTTVYGYVNFMYRIDLLKNKKLGSWHEPYGPFFIMLLLLVSHLFLFIDYIHDDVR